MAQLDDEPTGKRTNLGSASTSRSPNVNDDIWLAAVQGRVADLEAFLKAGHSIRDAISGHADSSGNSALHINAATGNEEVIQLLLEHTDDLNKSNKFKQTPLMLAGEAGHAGVVSLLLKPADSEVERRDSTGATALMLASRSGCLGVVQELLINDANVNAKDNVLDTPLLGAATGAWAELVDALLAARANIDQRNIAGESALIRSAMHPDPKVLIRLLNAGAQIDLVDKEMGFNALLFSASLGHDLVVSELLRVGANVSYTNQSGISALLLAARSGFLPVVKLLVEAGASVDHSDAKGFTPLMVSAIGGFKPVVQYLLEKGANINQRNYEGVTALSAAIEFSQEAVADFLLAAGADPDAGVVSSRELQSKGSPMASLPGSVPETDPDSPAPYARMPMEHPKTDSILVANNHSSARQQRQQQLAQQQQQYSRGNQEYDDDNASVSTNGHEPGTIVWSPNAKIVKFSIPHPDNPDDFYFYIPSIDDDDDDYDDSEYEKNSSGCSCVIS